MPVRAAGRVAGRPPMQVLHDSPACGQGPVAVWLRRELRSQAVADPGGRPSADSAVGGPQRSAGGAVGGRVNSSVAESPGRG